MTHIVPVPVGWTSGNPSDGLSFTVLLSKDQLVVAAYFSGTEFAFVSASMLNEWVSIYDLDDEDKFTIATAARVLGVDIGKMGYKDDRYVALESLEQL